MSHATADHPLLSDAPPGEVSQTDGSLRVVFHRRYRFPVEKVWAALTTPERLADWFAEAEVDLRVGGGIRLHFSTKGPTDMKITVCEAPRALAWVWTLGGQDTLVRFDLAPDAGGCQLTLTHSNVPRASGGVRAGWHAHLEAIPDAIEGRATAWEVKTAREAALGGVYPALGD
jgi:uncharacterized protein YndB with AHSA1/START domain